jgi:hypothetical protein
MKKFCLAAIALLAAGNTFAGTQTWNFGSSAAQLSGSGHGNELVLTSGTGGDQVTLTVSAWASTDNLCNAGGQYDTTNTLPDADPCIRDAKLKRWSSGLGIVNRDEDANNDEAAPQHAIDNIKNGAGGINITNDFDYEMVLLSFSSEVNLSALNIGWSLCGDNACSTDAYSNGGRDADISVLAHNGSSQDFFNVQTKWSDITSQGWSLVSNYSDLKTNQSVGISTSSYSKHWLVGAYNNVFDMSHWSVNNDAFKFAGLTSFTKDTSTAEPVSAPATLGLFGLITLCLLYRRKK